MCLYEVYIVSLEVLRIYKQFKHIKISPLISSDLAMLCISCFIIYMGIYVYFYAIINNLIFILFNEIDGISWEVFRIAIQPCSNYMCWPGFHCGKAGNF